MKHQYSIALAALTAILILGAGNALAFTTPGAGSAFYEVYDFVVNKMLAGAIGFLAGLGVIGLGVAEAIQHKFGPAVTAICSGVAIVNAPAIVTALGLCF
jgi:hypothetical protein